MTDKRLKDPTWRLENLYYIVDKKGRRVKFTPNTIQKRLGKSRAKRRRILKARQLGISTYEILRLADFAFFHKNRTVCILAHERDAIEKLFRIVQRAHKYMKEELRPAVDKGGGSKYEMFFPEINSRIYCDLESRGDTIHKLHISEKAFIKDISRVKATTEAVPIDGYVTEETTANGLNHFYDDYMDPDSNYENIFLPWYLHEEYQLFNHNITKKDLTLDEKALIEKAKKLFDVNLTLHQIAFRRFKKRELKEMFIQEYPEDDASCFLTSGNSIFDLSIVKPLFDDAKEPIREVNGIKIYEEMDRTASYVIGADTAEGVEGDNSSAHVFDIKKRKQVASFTGDIKPTDFADKLIEMSELYKTKWTPIIAVERNNHGHSVLLKLDEIHKYPALYKTENDRLGWITDKVTKPIMIDTLVEGVENGTATLTDKATLAECLSLINNNGKLEAEKGKKDDRVIAAAISLMVCIENDWTANYSNRDSLFKF